MFHAEVLVSQTLGCLFSGANDPIRLRRKVNVLIASTNLRQLTDLRIQFSEKRIAVHAHLAQQRRDQSPVLVYQTIQDMFRGDIPIMVFFRHSFCGLKCFDRFLCIVIGIHDADLLKSG